MADIHLTLPALILAFGALQGFLLAAMLFGHRRGQRPANRILAVLVLVISLQLSDACLGMAGLLERWPHLIFATRPLWFLIPPLLLAYVQRFLHPDSRFRAIDLLHLVPMLLALASLTRFYLLPGPAKVETWISLYGRSEPGGLTLFFWNFYTLQLTAYVAAAMGRLRAAMRDDGGTADPIRATHTRWVATLLGAVTVYLLLALVTIAILTATRIYVSLIDYLSIAMLTVCVHLIAVTAIRTPERLFPVLDRLAVKYRHSALSEDARHDLTERLTALMESERPFLNRDLRPKDLAGRLDITPHQLSQVLNQELEQSF